MLTQLGELCAIYAKRARGIFLFSHYLSFFFFVVHVYVCGKVLSRDTICVEATELSPLLTSDAYVLCLFLFFSFLVEILMYISAFALLQNAAAFFLFVCLFVCFLSVSLI